MAGIHLGTPARAGAVVGIEGAEVTGLEHVEAVAFAPILDRWLRPEAAISAADELPLLLGRDARAHRLVVRDGSAIVSHAALYTHRYRTPTGLLRIGVIGGVATDPVHRGRGHARRLIHALKQRARTDGLDAVILWDETGGGFYEPLGFLPAGQELIHSVPTDLATTGTSRVRPFAPADLPAIAALHSRERAHTERTLDDWRALVAIPDSTIHVLDHDGEVLFFGVVGKGIDLQGCLHEWAGPDALLSTFVTGILPLTDHDHLHVMSAPWRRSATRSLYRLGAVSMTGILGLAWMPAGGPFPSDVYLKGWDSM
jgi:GNAT superfamily N-acetyltransferase